MELLDLPPELFERVIELYVKKYGVKEAWKLRGICKTFQAEVEHEILAKQPIGAFLRFKNHNARTILKNSLGAYLGLRTKKLFGAHPFLPTFINGILDWLMEGETASDKVKYKIREGYADLLGRQLARECDGAWPLATLNPDSCKLQAVKPMLEGDVSTDHVAAAAAVGTFSVLHRKLHSLRDPKSLWAYSYAFGYPLAAAAGGNHLHIVAAIVKEFENNYRQNFREGHHESFKSAIDTSLKAQQFDVTFLLLQVYRTYFPVIPRKQYDKWLASALRDKNNEVLMELSTMRSEDCHHSFTLLFKLACERNDKDKIMLIFEEAFLDPNQDYSSSYAGASCPLVTAVQAGKLLPVQLLLDIDTNPDGVFVSDPCYCPLWVAVRKNKLGILQALLDYGANVELVYELWEGAEDCFKLPRKQIGVALKHAMKAGGYYSKMPSRRPLVANGAAVL